MNNLYVLTSKEVLDFVSRRSPDHVDWAMLTYNFKLMRGIYE